MSKSDSQVLEIPAPNFGVAEFTIEGIVPYCQNKFSNKVLVEMTKSQEAGSAGKSKKRHKSKNLMSATRTPFTSLTKGGSASRALLFAVRWFQRAARRVS